MREKARPRVIRPIRLWKDMTDYLIISAKMKPFKTLGTLTAKAVPLAVAACLAALAGCGSRASGGRADDSVAADTSATGWLRSVYDSVAMWYAAAERDPSLARPDFEAKYMSESYNTLYRAVLAVDERVEAEGMIGFFDSDHWVHGQDFGGVAFEVASDESAVAEGRLVVPVKVRNLGAVTPFRVVLTRENGQWRMDDIWTTCSACDPSRPVISEKEEMARYLEGE